MARIRYLKPDFFKDEDIKELPYDVRLFFAGLWCCADKAGRLEDRPQRLKVEIMPYDNRFDVNKSLEMLSRNKTNSNRPFIFRYAVEGERYIQILSWEKHQKPHHTEKESAIPPPQTPPLKENGEYKENGECSQSEYEVKERISNGDITVKELSLEEKIEIKWNEFAKKHRLAQIREIKKNSTRERTLRTRMKEKGFNFDELLEMISKSPFLLGQTKGEFFAAFDWIILPSNYQKIIEGNYLERHSDKKPVGTKEREWQETKRKILSKGEDNE